jgi:uncharacterized protein involved in exopolysaccharide biosynthesis
MEGNESRNKECVRIIIYQEKEMKEEITLRELIEIVLKGWKFIAVIILICVLIAGIISFYILEPTYEAKTVLMASYATEKLTNSNNIEDVDGILDSISVYPPMTIQTYKEQLRSPVILQQTIEDLELGAEGIGVSKLMYMISLETIDNTNLIAIKVTHNDPEIASEIANTLANRFTDFITDMSKERAYRSSEFLESQLEIEKGKLDEAFLERKQFLSRPRGVDELSGEVSSMLSMLNSYKTQIIQKEVELSKIGAGIQATTGELNLTPELLSTKKSLNDDLFINQIVSDMGNISIIDTSQLIMESEEINQNYLELKMKLSNLIIQKAELEQELKDIKVKIDEYQSTLEISQQDLAGKEYEKTLIDNKISISQETYDAFLKKYEESLIAESTKIGESSIDIVSLAMVPVEPIGPRKVFNLAIGAVLGLMIGTFGVFFRAYWKASAKAQ